MAGVLKIRSSPRKAGTQFLLDSRFRGNERSFNAAVVASLFMPPGGPALVEKCLDAFAPFGRRARFGDAANGQRLERIVDRAARDLGYQPFRARLGVWTSGEQSRNHSLDRFVEAGVRNHFVHEAQSARVRGGKRLPG